MHYRRIKIQGASYFITITLQNRKSTLLIDKIAEIRKSISQVKFRHKFQLNAAVILPDHLHLLITLPAYDLHYSKRVSLIKSNFSRLIEKQERISSSRIKKRERGIWQRRFWEHVIRDESDYEHHVNYIHYNPVKHGYVKAPIDWQYSTVHHYIDSGRLPKNWGGDLADDRSSHGE